MDETAFQPETESDRTALGPYEVTRERARNRSPRRFAVSGVVLLIGLASTIFHEVTYRAYPGERDFELGGLVSHAGGDMILMLILVVAGALYAENRK